MSVPSRSLFLKLSGAMEGAMVRLGEAASRDLYPVSQHYSRRLVAYIRWEAECCGMILTG